MPTIDYATDHVDWDAMFRPENVVLLQRQADAIRFHGEHRFPFVEYLWWFPIVLINSHSIWASAIPIVVLIMVLETVAQRFRGSAVFITLLEIRPIFISLILVSLWAYSDFPTDLTAVSLIALFVMLLVGWFRKSSRDRLIELCLTRIQPGIKEKFEEIERNLRASRFDHVAHLRLGMFDRLLRIGRVGGLMVSAGGRKHIINFASPENVTIAAEPRKPGSTRDRLWLLWNDERPKIRADPQAVQVFHRLKAEAVRTTTTSP